MEEMGGILRCSSRAATMVSFSKYRWVCQTPNTKVPAQREPKRTLPPLDNAAAAAAGGAAILVQNLSFQTRQIERLDCLGWGLFSRFCVSQTHCTVELSRCLEVLWMVMFLSIRPKSF